MKDKQILTPEERKKLIDSIIDDILALKNISKNSSDCASKEDKKCIF